MTGIRRASTGAAFGFAVLAAVPAFAADVTVAPGPSRLIEAIAQARAGDRLLLEKGVHAGPVVIDKALAIEGVEGAIVDAGGL